MLEIGIASPAAATTEPQLSGSDTVKQHWQCSAVSSSYKLLLI